MRFPPFFPTAVVLTSLFTIMPGCTKRDGSLSAFPSSIVLTATETTLKGKLADASTRLRNDGEKSLRILSISSSCSCTSIDSPSVHELAPGQQIQLKLKVSVPAYGRSNSTIVVETDSPVTPSIKISVDLIGDRRPIPYIQNQTAHLILRGSSPGELVQGTVELRTIEKRGSAPAVECLKSTTTNLTSTRKEVIDADPIGPDPMQRIYLFEITTDCPDHDMYLGELFADISENEPALSRRTTRLSVEVFRAISIIPSEIELKLNERETDFRRRIVVVSNDDLSFRVLDARWCINSTSSQSLIDGVPSGAHSATHALDVMLHADEDQCPEEVSYVELTTSHPLSEKCRIPVRLVRNAPSK